MGDVIRFERPRARRQAAGGARAGSRPLTATFWFDLSSPLTYLAAERVERLFHGVELRPAIGAAAGLDGWTPAEVEERAAQLRVPLVWPERPSDARRAMRVAACAVEQQRAAPFVLAAARLAYCGGFDLNDPEVLAEAAAASGVGLEDCIAAAADASLDAEMEEQARHLREHGADRLPALRIGRTLFCGEDRIAEAAAAARSRFARRMV